MSIEDLLYARQSSSNNKENSNTSRWLGRVRLLAIEEQGEQEYTTTVAAWTHSREGFDQLLQHKIVSRHLRLVDCENAMPAVKWLYHYPNDYASLELAQGVFETWPIAFGKLIKVEKALEESATAENYLSINAFDIEPLDGQFGVHPKKQVPDTLYPFLFDQPAPSDAERALYSNAEGIPPLKTYAVLDAEKIIYLNSLLEHSGLAYRCLLKGEAAVESALVAPYLVALDAENALTGILFTYDPDFPDNQSSVHLWHQEPGFYIRSRGDIDTVAKHLRKFLRIPDENGKWFQLRFWKLRGLMSFLTTIQQQPADVKNWIRPHDTYALQRIIVPSVDTTYVINPEAKLFESKVKHRSLVFSQALRDSFDHSVETLFQQQLAQDLFLASPKQCAALRLKDSHAIAKMIASLSEILAPYDFSGKANVGKIAAMALFYGTHFLNDPRISPTANHHLVHSQQAPAVRAKYFSETLKAQALGSVLLNNSQLEPIYQALDTLPRSASHEEDSLVALCKAFPHLISEETIDSFVRRCTSCQATRQITTTTAKQVHLLCALLYSPYFLDDPLQGALQTAFATPSDSTLIAQVKAELKHRIDIQKA